MRRSRFWLAFATAALVVGGAIVLSLPAVARWAAVRQLEALTGRDVTIADVDLNLFTRRLAVIDLRVAGRDGEPSPLVLPRLDVAFRLLPLLSGRVHLDRLEARDPKVEVTRLPDGALSVEDIVERLRARPPGKPLPFTIGDGRFTGGQILLDDRAVSPPRQWQAADLRLEGHDISSLSEGHPGTARLRFELEGAPVDVQVTRIGLRPLHAQATATVQDLDLSPVALYAPPDAAVRPVAGRFSARIRADYDAETGLLADSDSIIRELVMRRQGQDAPFVTTPALTTATRGVRYHDGVASAARIETRGAPSVLDASVDPAQRHDVRVVHLVAEDLTYPARAPGRVTLSVALAAGGTLEARGDLTVYPVAADLAVRLADLDLARARPYLPEQTPLRLTGGVASAALDLRYATAAGLRLSGDVTVHQLAVAREGQREPFISHRELTGSIADLRVRKGSLALGRVTLTGAPVIVDASVSPPQRFEIAALSLTVRELTWPVKDPAQVEGRARMAAGATATLDGIFDPDTLRTDVRARFRDVDVLRFAGYVPADAPVRPAGGVARSDVRVRFARGKAVTIDASGVVRDAALARRDDDEPFLTVPALELGVAGLAIEDGAMAAQRVTLRGAPVVRVDGRPPRRLAVPGLSIAAEGATWPERHPATVALEARLPGSGTLNARGDLRLAQRRAELSVEVADAAVDPYATILGLTVPVDGRLRATVHVTASVDGAARVEATGRLAARELALGAPEQPVARIEHLQLAGIHLRWPEMLEIEEAVVTKPSVLVEREKDGSFPLRTMMALPGARERGSLPADETAVSALPRPDADRDRFRLAVDEFRVLEGDVRFVDRTTTPFYSEEATRLAVTMDGFSTAPDAVARLSLQGIVGAEAALDLDGTLDAFGGPLVLEVAGDLRDFSVPRTNPYLQRFLDWIARRGELTTKVHYRIEGQELTGSNEIVVQRLDVAPAGRDPDKLVGLPLGLVVSLLKNPQGDIRLTLPVSGDLSSPKFDFGDAIRTALRHVLTRLVVGPLQAIGRIFKSTDDQVQGVAVDPVVFAPGSAVVGPDAAKQVQRVADFLRASPFVGLVIAPVVTHEDMLALKAQAVASQVQRLQRGAGLPDFAAAARTLFQSRFPQRTPPERLDAVIAALRDVEPVADEAARTLAARRLRSTRQALTDAAGIEAARLREVPQPPAPGAPGPPRVEFELASSG